MPTSKDKAKTVKPTKRTTKSTAKTAAAAVNVGSVLVYRFDQILDFIGYNIKESDKGVTISDPHFAEYIPAEDSYLFIPVYSCGKEEAIGQPTPLGVELFIPWNQVYLIVKSHNLSISEAYLNHLKTAMATLKS
jgi:hypothetical protein